CTGLGYGSSYYAMDYW
nr:immunoglobulin heavy chain junction region [Mus musculus]